ncbi:MAG TPA: SIMPL domain-containing protein [Rhodanobacteraceae bacterium]
MRRFGLIVLMLCLPAAAWAQVHALPSAPHILVKGHAQGQYVPDRFTIHLGVDVIDKVPDAARRKVDTYIKAILTALKKTGALAGKTHASSLRISPDYEYRDQKRVFVGTEVSRGVSATFDALPDLQHFIAKVKASKEVRIDGIDVGRSDIGKIRMHLRAQAVANSRAAARQLAAAYGVRITGLYSVSEVAPQFAYGVQAGSWDDGAGGRFGAPPPAPPPPSPPKVVGMTQPPPPRLEVGTITVEMNMYAVYLIGSAASSSH